MLKTIAHPASRQRSTQSLEENATEINKQLPSGFFSPIFLKLWVCCIFFTFSGFFSGNMVKRYYRCSHIMPSVFTANKSRAMFSYPAWKHRVASRALCPSAAELKARLTSPWRHLPLRTPFRLRDPIAALSLRRSPAISFSNHSTGFEPSSCLHSGLSPAFLTFPFCLLLEPTSSAWLEHW